jgi:hypothetical protein
MSTPTQPTTIRELLLENCAKRIATLEKHAPQQIVDDEKEYMMRITISSEAFMEAKLVTQNMRITPTGVTYSGIENGAMVGEDLTVVDTDQGTLVILKGRVFPVAQLTAKDLEFWP